MPLVNVNCDCEDDTTGRRTLAELRSALTTALGFVAEQGNAPARTLAEMRFDLIRQLGFTDLPADPPAQTLAQIRAQVEHHLGFVSQQDDPPPRDLESMRLDLMRRLGFSAQANNPPPGMSEMLASFLEDAQETVYHRFELDQSGSYSLAPFSAPGDITTIDPRPVLLLALANAKAHYGQPDAKAYYDQVERYLSDVMRRNPPGATERLDAFIRSAQETVFRRFEMDGDGVYALAPLIADTDTTRRPSCCSPPATQRRSTASRTRSCMQTSSSSTQGIACAVSRPGSRSGSTRSCDPPRKRHTVDSSWAKTATISCSRSTRTQTSLQSTRRP